VDPRAGLDGRKISSPPEFNPGPSSPYVVCRYNPTSGNPFRTVSLNSLLHFMPHNTFLQYAVSFFSPFLFFTYVCSELVERDEVDYS